MPAKSPWLLYIMRISIVRPEALLNRWIVPLDRGIDFLTLGGGKKFEIPFDLFLVFASNLEPAQLGDEAFLRRALRTRSK